MLIDAYQHIGMPRFQTAEDGAAVMDTYGIDRAVVCPFETCPDIAGVHRAMRSTPERFRGAGIPLGRDRSEMTGGLRAQLDAGFAGARLSGGDVAERPWLLDVLGEGHAFALVCGAGGLAEGAEALLAYLERYDDALVVGGHCAGPVDPGLFDTNAAVADLFGHERFTVVLSRQGLFPDTLIKAWTAALIDRVGWARLLWGSEAPVLHWRDESMEEAKDWILQFSPPADQLEAFRAGNAARVIFSRPVEVAKELRLPFDPWAYEVRRPSPTWPFGLPLDTALSGRLLRGWVAWGGGERGPLRHYLEHVLDQTLPADPAA